MGVDTQFLEINGLNIATYQSKGKGATALLIHGNSSSGQTYQAQLEGPLGQEFRLIALDLPGHGQSGRATDLASYSLPGYAKVVAQVARQLQLERYAVIGWSLGGHIALEAVAQLGAAVQGYLIYGTPPMNFPPPMERAFLPNPSMASIFKAELSEEEIAAWGSADFKPGATVPAQFFEDVKRTDGQARLGLAASIASGNLADEIEAATSLKVPLAILQGEQEQLVNLEYLQSLSLPTLWRNQIQIVPDAGHTIHAENPAAFERLVADFLGETA